MSSTERTRRRFLRSTVATAGLVTLGGFGTGSAGALPTELAIGEVGTELTNQPNRDRWHSVEFDNILVETLGRVGDLLGVDLDPVVVMKPVSYRHSQPCHVRLRNVTSSGFEYQIEEWDYLDGAHGQELMYWVAMIPGLYEIPLVSGTTTGIEVGTVPVDTDPQNVTFDFQFDGLPGVVAQTQTKNSLPDALVTRVDVASNENFNVRLQEQEANNNYSRTEEVGYIAFEVPTIGILDTLGLDGTLVSEFEARRPSKTIADSPPGKRIPFQVNGQQGFSRNPRVVADIQTRRGPQPCQLRRTDLTRQHVDFFVEEEQSADTETNHAPEDIAFFAFDGNGLIPGLALNLGL